MDSITYRDLSSATQAQPSLLMDRPINPSRISPEVAQAKASSFAEKWHNFQFNEPQYYQAHFNELCEIVGHEVPSYRVGYGNFEFQQPAPTPGNRRGFADVYLRDHFIMEYKKRGKSLDEAYTQALKYRDSLGNPPLLIVSDFETIRIHTNFTGTVSDTYTITLDDLHHLESEATRKDALGVEGASPLSVYQVLRYCFFEPGNLKPVQTPEKITETAADAFREISDELQEWNSGKHTEIARFLSQLLFCMFASDMGLLEKGRLTKMMDALGDSPSQVFQRRLTRLFADMSKGDHDTTPPIRWFDGGLFDRQPHDLEIDGSLMQLIREADALDWSQIEPSIFGTLFERVFNPEKRAQHGRHYTSRTDIETIVEPVVMVPLHREWDKVKSDVFRKRLTPEDSYKVVQEFLVRLGEVRILDPACGSGNFLYVALNLMHGLEREVIAWALECGLEPPVPQVHPRQLLGIENDEYAHQLASVVVWIGHIQNELRVGSDVENREPILEPLDNIELRDAILDLSSNELCPAEWPEVDFIVGNPPFLGSHLIREELGEDYTKQIQQVWQDRVPATADLCTFWFEQARSHIADGKAKRAGLLATQGIRGVASRHVLERIKESGDIFFAESDRDWRLEGAAVHTSMVGFDDGSEKERVLDGKRVDVIHSNLTSGRVDLTKARRLKENLGIAFKGTHKTGPFNIPEDVAQEMLNSTNPDGRSNGDVVKPFLIARDVMDIPRNHWIIDFDADMSEEEASKYIAPFNYIETHVKPYREERPRLGRYPWWIHHGLSTGMRRSLEKLDRFIVTPRHSKHRVFSWVEHPTLPDGALVVFARDDDYFMGILHSRPHRVWSLAMGSQLRDKASGFRYTHMSCFETFPFPRPTDEQQENIAELAKTLTWHRGNMLGPIIVPPNNRVVRIITLTSLYNEYDRWLKQDHLYIDKAVFAAYGWGEDPEELDDDTILERLLELNLTREGA